MKHNPFTPVQNLALLDLRLAWPRRKIVLIGASALACQIEMTWRRTNDLDLTIVADQIELAADLRALGWVRSERMEQRWTSPHGVVVDALPTTPTSLTEGSMTFSESGHVMNLTGFDLALTHNIPMPLNQDISLAVAAVPVVIVLKMAAWLDRPSERDRDLQDIAHVLNEYLVPDDARRAYEHSDVGLAANELNQPLVLGAP